MKHILSVFCLVLLSCSSSEPKSTDSGSSAYDEEKFKSEWDIWKDQDIKNYSFTLKASIDGNYEVAIIVKNGIMDSFKYTGKTPNGDLEPEYTSISDMYQKIYDNIKYDEIKIQESSKCSRFAEYETAYDQKFHYIKNFEAIYGAYGCEGGSNRKLTVSNFSKN